MLFNPILIKAIVLKLHFLRTIEYSPLYLDVSRRFKRRPRSTVRPVFHPATPMDEGESRIFRISQTRFIPQPGRETCGLNAKTYLVRKIPEIKTDYEGDYITFHFYAISGVTDFSEILNGNVTHKFESQVAYIRCSHGWIHWLDVFRNRLGVTIQENARGCGIGVVLTELCLIDPDIIKMRS